VKVFLDKRSFPNFALNCSYVVYYDNISIAKILWSRGVGLGDRRPCRHWIFKVSIFYKRFGKKIFSS